MATKPTDNAPDWAANANYTGGPDIGKPTKYTIPGGVATEGHRGGKLDPTLAQYFNDFLHKVARLCRWVFAGSSTGAGDAHIVETNDDGGTSVQSLYVAGAADPGTDALRVDGPTSSYGAWVRGHADSTSPASKVSHAGDAIGLEVTSDSTSQPALSAGVSQFTGDTVRPALVANSAADLSATIIGNHTGANGSGLSGSGTGTEPGVKGFAAGTGAGVKGIGSTGPGVDGLGPTGVKAKASTNTGFGVFAESAAGATSGAAVRAAGFGDADGVSVVTVNGHGVSALAGAGDGANLISSSGRAAFFNGNSTKCTTVHNPESADPGSPEDGGMWYRDNVGHKVRREGVTRTLYDTAGGMAFAAAYNANGGSVTDTPTDILSATFAGGNIPTALGVVLIRVAVEVGRDSGTPDAVLEITNGIVLATVDVSLFQAAGVFERHIAVELPYTLLAVGAQTFRVSLKSTVPGDDINWRNGGISVVGVF